jgi:hypothetical protein
VDTEVVLRVDEDGAGAERLAELAGALRTELLALDVDDVRPVRGGLPPAGARGFDMVAAGALLASLNGSAAVVGNLVATVRSWLCRGPVAVPRTVELTVGANTLRVTGASDEQQDRLVDAFVDAIARP